MTTLSKARIANIHMGALVKGNRWMMEHFFTYYTYNGFRNNGKGCIGNNSHIESKDTISIKCIANRLFAGNQCRRRFIIIYISNGLHWDKFDTLSQTHVKDGFQTFSHFFDKLRNCPILIQFGIMSFISKYAFEIIPIFQRIHHFDT